MNTKTKKAFESNFDNSEDFQFDNMKDYESGKFEDTMTDEQKEATFATLSKTGAVSNFRIFVFILFDFLDHRTFRTKS